MKPLYICMTLITLFSCSSVEVPSAPPKSIVVLVDISGSTNTPAMKQLYENAFRDVLRTVTQGDALVVSFISDKSVAELELPINVLIPDENTASDNTLVNRGNKIAADSTLAALKIAFEMKFDSLMGLSARKVPHTDIISSLMIAERCFKSYAHSRNVVIILSDMVEESGGLNFLRERLSKSRRSDIIRSLDRQNRLANLKDAHIYVIGASAPDLTRYFEIRDFWLEFFRTSGAVMLPEQYGSALIRINEGG